MRDRCASLKMKKTLDIFIAILIFFGCKNQSKELSGTKNKIAPTVKKWTNQGECFDNLEEYKPSNDYEFIKSEIFKKKSNSTYHLLTCRYDGLPYLHQLDETIDIESLEDYGEFLADRNYVYFKYLISDGFRIFRLDTADRPTFRSFGKTIYARDKNHIYDSRHGIIENADLESFRPIAVDRETGGSSYGRDKDNYFFWDEIVEDTIELKKYLKI